MKKCEIKNATNEPFLLKISNKVLNKRESILVSNFFHRTHACFVFIKKKKSERHELIALFGRMAACDSELEFIYCLVNLTNNKML